MALEEWLMLWRIAKIEREMWVKVGVFPSRRHIRLSTSLVWMKLAVPLTRGHISELTKKLAVFLARRHIWLSTSFRG